MGSKTTGMWIILLALGLFAQAVAQVHKCEAGGQTVYQATPCAAGTAGSMEGSVSVHEAPDLQPFETYQVPERSSRQAYSTGGGRQSSLQRRNEEVKARARDQVLVGMSERQVTSILGRPDEVDTQSTSSGNCKLMYYWDDHEITDYIRVCNGEVEYARQ